LPPFSPVKADKNGKVEVWGRIYTLDKFGLIARADIQGKAFFTKSVSFEISINGKPAVFKSVSRELIKNPKGKAEYLTTAEGQDANLEIRTIIEYDGMIKTDFTIQPKKSIELSGFNYSINYPEANAQFIHYAGAPDTLESQMISRNSYTFKLPEKQQGKLWESSFKTLVWLGNKDNGFLWFCASEKNWAPQDRKLRPDALKAERYENNVTLEISPVTKPEKISKPVTFTFGMFATPVRPEPQGWRDWILISNNSRAQIENHGEKIGNMLYVGSEAWLQGFYQRLKDPKAFSAVAEAAHKDGRLILPYLDPIEMSIGRVKKTVTAKPGIMLNDLQTVENDTMNPDNFAWQPPEIKYIKEWMTQPNMVLGYGMSNGDRQLRVSPASGWADFLCFIVEKMAESGADGLGDLDNCYPTFDMNGAHNMGYTDENGVRHVEYDWFSRRDLTKRIAAIFLRVRGKSPVIVAHSSATWSIPFISFCDINLTLENSNTAYFNPDYMCKHYQKNYDKIKESLSNGGKDFLYWAFPIERWQAEYTGRQFGLPVMILPNIKKSKHMDSEYAKTPAATRDLNCMIVIHDNIVWPLWCDPKPFIDAWKIRHDFGIGEAVVKFLPYWGNEHVAACKENEVYISSYINKNKHLLCISNTGLENKTCTVELNLSFFNNKVPSKVVDAETKKEIAVEKGLIVIPINRRDYKLLLVE